MALVKMDLRGLRCPAPSLKISATIAKKEVQPGDLLEVTADCPSFEADIKKVCTTWKKQLLKTLVEENVKTVTIKI